MFVKKSQFCRCQDQWNLKKVAKAQLDLVFDDKLRRSAKRSFWRVDLRGSKVNFGGPNKNLSGWWWLEHHWMIFPSIGNVIIPIDFYIFQRGGSTTNQLRFVPGIILESFIFDMIWPCLVESLIAKLGSPSLDSHPLKPFETCRSPWGLEMIWVDQFNGVQLRDSS